MTKAPEGVWAWPIDNPIFCTSHEEPMNREARHFTLTDTLSALLAAEREKALREAASVALNACLVPPDGGSPTVDEVAVCDAAYDYILALIDAETDPQPDLPRTREPQAAKPSAGERLIDSAKGARAAFHIEDARAMAEYACDVIDANSQCDESACCDGRECGCGGETVHEHMKAMIRAMAGIEQEGE